MSTMGFIGKQIGSYRIDQKIGEGGMGTVYRGLELNLERPVAIKVLNADLAGKPAIVERFRAEARAQANLNHTNVAILYAFLFDEDTAMMVMEYVAGLNLQQMVAGRGPIPAAEAIPLFRQALAGVGAAHRMGIVHRDIKPANIMVNQLGVVKVMDFGIAKVVGDRNLTRTGVQIGTVYYMSPEQVKSLAVDSRSDIYALGVTLYELLTARVPFAGESEFDVLTDHVNTPPVVPTVHSPSIPKGIANIVLKALEKKPEDRFQTVEEFSDALANPQAWESYVPKTVVVVSPAMAPTMEIDTSSFAQKADNNLTLPPPEPLKSFWTPARVGIASFLGVVLAGAAVIGPSLLSLKTPPPKPVATTPSVLIPSSPQPAIANTPGREDSTGPVPAPAPGPVEAPPPAKLETPKPAAGRYTIPSKTIVGVRLAVPLDSGLAAEGQTFTANISRPVIVNGQSLLSGAEIRLTKLVKASKSKPARLELELASITVGGQRYTVKSDRLEISGDGTTRRKGKLFGRGSVADKAVVSDDVTFTLTPETALSFNLKNAVQVIQP